VRLYGEKIATRNRDDPNDESFDDPDDTCSGLVIPTKLPTIEDSERPRGFRTSTLAA
jgi:hypothetical protein